MKFAHTLSTLGAVLALIPSPAYAAKTCVPFAVSVPKDYDPPAWGGWSGTRNDTSLDDPRWNGANADSYSYGSSSAPLHVRSVWKDDYLYLSFISDLSPNPTNPRDIFVGFRRVNPIAANATTGTPAENAYIFQVHIEKDSVPDATAVPFCTKWAATTYACGDSTAKKVFWRVFADQGTDKTCGSLVMKRQFKQTANPGWVDGNVHAWQRSDGTWAVQMRVKLDRTSTSAAPSPLSKGIEVGSMWWYEGTESTNPNNLDAFALGKLPATSGTFCRFQQNLADEIVHEKLGSASEWAALELTANGAMRSSDCDNGLYIDRGHLGAVFDQAGPYDNVGLSIDIKARRKSDNAAAANTIIAQVVNGTGAPFSGKLRGRFKLADWGATVPGVGDWIDIPADPGTKNPAEATVSNLAAGAQAAVSFNWTLTEPDYCKYSLAVPGFPCTACTPCSDTVNGCTQVKKSDGSMGPCQPVKTRDHQCLQVEISAPNAAERVQQHELR
jgi:hypothetical protein